MVHGLDIVFHMDAITVIIFIIFTCFIAIFCASITSNGRSGSSGLGLGSGIPGDRGGGDCLVGGSGHRGSHRGVLLRERSSIQGQRASRQQTILVVRIRESRGHQRRDCDEGCGDHPQQEGTVVDRCLPLTHLVCPLHGKPFAIAVALCHPSLWRPYFYVPSPLPCPTGLPCAIRSEQGPESYFDYWHLTLAAGILSPRPEL